MQQPHILIIGAGFGGLELAKRLRNKPVRVTLIDKHNYHLFQPLLYQVATGGLEPDSIAYPIRKIFHRAKNIQFRLAEVERIDAAAKEVITKQGRIAYDHLVLATGSCSHFFNFAPVEDLLMPLKSVTDALNLRSYILQNMETASAKALDGDNSEVFNIAIVGGGPTGVELAGAFAEMKRYVFPHDYPQLNLDHMRVVLYEAAPLLLSSMSEEASEKAHYYLDQLGVEVQVNTMVESYDGINLTTKAGDTLATKTVVWSAGVKGNTPAGISAEALTGSRIRVDAYNRIPGMPDTYAIGDVAALIDEENPKGYPMLAQVAIQQGKNLGNNLLRWAKKEEAKPFRYRDLGTMATIGRSRAVVDLPFIKFQGFFAWVTWMFVHIASLVGFRNKLSAFWEWAFNFFTYDRAMRLIIRPYQRPAQEVKEPTEEFHHIGT